MGTKRKNAKKKKRNYNTQKTDKKALKSVSVQAQDEQEWQNSEDEAVNEFVVSEPESETTYDELFLNESIEIKKVLFEDVELVRENLRRSIAKAGRRELAGKRKIRVPFERILSKFLWTAVVFLLVGIIVWQSAEVVAAKVEYTRGNEFYKDLANKLSLSSGDDGFNSILYGEKTLSSLPDYEAMQNGAVISNKQTLTSKEKKELAVYNAKLAALNKQNPDTVGWIYIPGTNIDYPIVMPPAEDPDYYMDHDFSGANYSQGAIFIETRCRPGILQNKNTIIVGHNIRLQGMMFNQLVKFGEEEFFKEHSEIYIYTEEGKFVFNVFSFYRVNEEYNFRRVNFSSD